MVEYQLNLNEVFSSLADPTRRDILSRLIQGDLTIGELAEPYKLTFAAVSKHLKVLENAHLVVKQKRGKERVVKLSANALADADAYLSLYRKHWEDRFEALDTLLTSEQINHERNDS
jgi:DNA-binding transcriptional ArsR family regulator